MVITNQKVGHVRQKVGLELRKIFDFLGVGLGNDLLGNDLSELKETYNKQWKGRFRRYLLKVKRVGCVLEGLSQPPITHVEPLLVKAAE